MMSNRELIVWKRLLAEAVAIIASILLAFAIDAWWASRNERSDLDRQLEAVRSELLSNRIEIEARQHDVARALRAAQELVRASRPHPVSLSADSLGRLIHNIFDLGPANLVDATLSALLATAPFGLVSEPELHASLVGLRVSYETHRANAAIFAEIREATIRYLSDMIPVGIVSQNTGAHDPTDFPVPVTRLLSDPRLEGHIGNLAVRILLLGENLERLLADTDAMLHQLPRRRAF